MASRTMSARASALALALVARLAMGAAVGSRGAVFGYAPAYRHATIDWASVVRSTTHVTLFSLQPTAEGELKGDLENLLGMLQADSAFRRELDKMGADAPKVLITVGGAGTLSKHFAEMADSKKSRKRLAEVLVEVFMRYPLLRGVDLNWEMPETAEHWRNLGRLAREVRQSVGAKIKGFEITTSYHPRSGAVDKFSGLKSKKSDKSFVEYFDYMHAMTYAQFDAEKRHSSDQMDKAAVDEWKAAGLPPGKLTLGLPFFGVLSKTGETKSYSEIIDAEPSLADRLGVDVTKKGYFFVNGRAMAKKVQFAASSGLAGVMLWELGQDKPKHSGASLLEVVRAAMQDGSEPVRTWRETFLTRFNTFGEDNMFSCIGLLLGAYYLFQVLTAVRPRDLLQPPPRPPAAKKDGEDGKKAAATSEGAAADGAVATSEAAAAEDSGAAERKKD